MSSDRIAVTGGKLSEPPEADTLMALLTEVNHLLGGRVGAKDVYARVIEAVRERLGAFCVAVVYAGRAANPEALALSISPERSPEAPSFRRSELSDWLKEGRLITEMAQALGRAGVYSRKLRTERAL